MLPSSESSRPVKGTQPQPSRRYEAIDQYRGLAILLMVLADYLSGAGATPDWLKHASDIGYTVIDLIAPMFVFAMGLTFGLSFRRRLARNGSRATYTHFISRNLALVGLGFLITMGGQLSGIYESTVNWGLLQALGAAGLITLLFIRLPAAPRALAGLLLLAVYQALLHHSWLDLVQAAPHNGPWGALSWAAMLILATAMADLYHDITRQRALLWVSVAAASAGLILAIWFPISKSRASVTYVLLSLGLSGLVFVIIHLLVRRFERGLPVLNAWGRNALLLYLLHGIVIGLFALPSAPWWYANAAPWLVLLQAASLVGILSWVGMALDRQGLYFSL